MTRDEAVNLNAVVVVEQLSILAADDTEVRCWLGANKYRVRDIFAAGYDNLLARQGEFSRAVTETPEAPAPL